MVVTDFGLARALEIEEGASSRSGPLVGTCAYMSPEQVEGGSVGAAADVYALGIVLYEMVTGRRPFRGETALATALQRMREAPPPPTRDVPDLDPRWEEVILRCLARDPASRFARPEDVVAALTGAASAAHPAERGGPARRGALALVAAAAAALAVAPAVSRPWAAGSRAAGADAVAGASRTGHPSRPLVALVGFTNLSGRADARWLSTALAEMLRTELTLGGSFRAVPAESVARMKRELALTDADSLAGDTLARVRANVGADFVVLGSYLALSREAGARIRVELRVQDAQTGETTAALAETGSESDILDLVSRLGARLREGLGADGQAPAPASRRALPATPDALRLYAEGLGALRDLDAKTASRLLQRAVGLEPDSPFARAALAEAFTALGSDRRAREEAEKAYLLSASLSSEERRWVEGRYLEAAQDWGGAASAYAALLAEYPDNLEYGLRLAAARTAMGRPREAVATLAALRSRGGPAAEDARIDLAESQAGEALSDFERARQFAAVAAAKGARQTARVLVARARLQEARMLQRLGDHGQARERLLEAQRLSIATGDTASVSWANLHLGLLRFSGGEPDEARLLFNRALEAFDALGHRRGRAIAQAHLAMVHWKQGRLARAKALWEEALTQFRDMDDKASIARNANNLAVVAQNEGDLERAARLYQEALDMARRIGDKRTVGITLANVADVTAERGELRAAEKLYEESLTVVEEIGLKTSIAGALFRLGDLRLQMGDLEKARAAHQRALAIRVQLGQKMFLAESRVALGRVALEAGDAAGAERAVRGALGELRRLEASDDEAVAQALLASALAAQGRWRDARIQAQRARDTGDRSANQLVRVTVAIAAARLEALGDPSPAGLSGAAGQAGALRGRQELEAALAEARKSGRRGVEMEARLALAEVLLAAGGDRAALLAVENDARVLGYGLVARKAAGLAVRGAAVSTLR